jgi:hypothetical protein
VCAASKPHVAKWMISRVIGNLKSTWTVTAFYQDLNLTDRILKVKLRAPTQPVWVLCRSESIESWVVIIFQKRNVRVRWITPDLNLFPGQIIVQPADLRVVSVECTKSRTAHTLNDVRVSKEGRRNRSTLSDRNSAYRALLQRSSDHGPTFRTMQPQEITKLSAIPRGKNCKQNEKDHQTESGIVAMRNHGMRRLMLAASTPQPWLSRGAVCRSGQLSAGVRWSLGPGPAGRK